MMIVNSPQLLSDPVDNWATRLKAASYAAVVPTGNTAYAHQHFLVDIEGVGLTDKVKTAATFVWEVGTTNDERKSFIITPFLDNENNSYFSFVVEFSPFNFSITGLTGNKTGYISTGQTCTGLGEGATSGDVGYGMMVTGITYSTNIDIGVYDGTRNQQLRCAYNTFPGLFVGNIYGDGTPASWPSGKGLGYYSMNAVDQTTFAGYFREQSVSHTQYITGNPHVATPVITYYQTIFAYNALGVSAPNLRSNNTLSFVWFGRGLTAAQDDDLYEAIYSLRERLGGGFV